MPNEEKKHLEDVIQHFTDAMLVSVDPEIGMRARPMHIVQQNGANLVFATTLDNEAVDELLKDDRILCTLQGDRRYVSITGKARFNEDPTRIEEVWSPAMRPWFPEGPTQKDLVLIEVDADSAEYWDMTGATRVGFALGLVKALVKGERMEPSTDPKAHGQVRL